MLMCQLQIDWVLHSMIQPNHLCFQHSGEYLHWQAVFNLFHGKANPLRRRTNKEHLQHDNAIMETASFPELDFRPSQFRNECLVKWEADSLPSGHTNRKTITDRSQLKYTQQWIRRQVNTKTIWLFVKRNWNTFVVANTKKESWNVCSIRKYIFLIEWGHSYGHILSSDKQSEFL